MTTAAIHYNPRTGEPEIVVINGASAPVTIPAGQTDTADYRTHIIDGACRTLGWRVMAHARIVRQSDGRGVVRIEPNTTPANRAVTDDAGPLDVTPEEELRSGDPVYIHTENGWPLRLSVGGHVYSIAGHFRYTERFVGTGAVTASKGVDATLDLHGYRRVGPITPDTIPGRWVCLAEPVTDWRDQPTLVRLDDDTNNQLQRVAALLDIPADHLAATWICRAAADAIRRHERFTEPGYILDHSRIRGWLHDGTPDLKD